MKLANRMDAELIRHVLGAMTVGMKGEVFASLVLSDLRCVVENANAAKANCMHIDLLITRNNRTEAIQVKSTAVGSKGSFIGVNDSLVADGVVKWFCIPTLDNKENELLSLFFVHVDELRRVGRRFPSNNKKCEVLHSKISTLAKLTAVDWVTHAFGTEHSAMT